MYQMKLISEHVWDGCYRDILDKFVKKQENMQKIKKIFKTLNFIKSE